MTIPRSNNENRPELQVGTRVKVVKDKAWNGPWPDEPMGVIELALQNQLFIMSPTQGGGTVRQYKVRFDTPQYDGDKQGPYVAAVISQEYLVVET